MTNATISKNVNRRGRSAWAFPALLAAWIAAYFAARAVLEQAGLSLPVRAAVAVAPVAVFGIVLFAAVRAIRRSDELEQRIHLLAPAVAYPLLGAAILLFGPLDRAQIVGRQSLTDLWPIFTSLYVVAYAFARRRYHPDASGDADETSDREDVQ